MPTVPLDAPRPRIVVFGIRCRFSQVVYSRLIDLGHDIRGIILAGPPRLDQPIRLSPRGPSLPLAHGDRTEPFGSISGVPTYQVGRLSSPSSVDLIRSLQPDVIVVACFPRRIPRAIREIPRLGALNIHPSLLPANRGPDPLFWILREGSGTAGVTVHDLADRFDAGDILAQRSVHCRDGISEVELERQLATIGADLTAEVIDTLATGTARRVPQDEAAAGYQSWPTEDDYIIDTDRPARSAFNFIRGIAHRGTPVRIRTEDGLVTVAEALAYGDSQEYGRRAIQSRPSGIVKALGHGDGDQFSGDIPDGTVAIAFNPGWLLVRPLEDDELEETNWRIGI